MDGGEIIAQVIKSHGIDILFTLCGGHISPILVGAKNQGIRVIDVRNEATAIFAADCYSRLMGKPGVAVVTAGPGVTNSVTAIKNAQIAQSPLVLLGGAVATLLKNRGALQDIDQLKLYESITKWAISIQQNCDIVPIIEEAFDVAASGVPGPVFIECPIDILYDEDLVKKWYKMSMNDAHNIKEKVINWYIRRHADKLFACSDKEINITNEEKVIPFTIDLKKLELTLNYINNSTAPVMVLGSQALLRIKNIPDLISAIEKINIPVYLTGMTRGLLGDDHPLYVRHHREHALKEADLVILAGIPMDFRLDYGRIINNKAVLITLNRSEIDLRKNRQPTIGIQTDASTFLIELVKYKVFEQLKWEDWLLNLKSRDKQRATEIYDFMKTETDYINPLQLCDEINKTIDNNSIIIGDGGDFIATSSYIIHPRAPLSWLDPGPYGTLGIGAGFALASKLVNPNKDVWLLYGDGAAGYSITEFDTFVRHKVPIIAIIGNDAGWTQIARSQIEYLKDDVGTILDYSNYELVAEAYGAKGFKVKSLDNIKTIFQNALHLSRNGVPVLINALIGKTDFRKGSISM